MIPHRVYPERFQGLHSSRWQFWRDGISQSFIRQFLTCLEQTRLQYVEGWEVTGINESWETGSAVHYAIAEAIRRETRRLPTYRDCCAWVCEYLDGFKHKRLGNRTTVKQESVLNKIYLISSALSFAYCQHWAGDFSRGTRMNPGMVVTPVKWIAVEKWFHFEHTFADGKKVPVKGIWDGIFQARNPKDWLLETKLKSRIDMGNLIDTLQFDLQVNLYLWARKVTTGNMPAGVMYNILKRPGHRQGKKETESKWLERMCESIMDEKSWPDQFYRLEMRVLTSELSNWYERTFSPIMETIRMWWEGRLPHFCNADNLTTKFGRVGMYDKIVHGDGSRLRQKSTSVKDRLLILTDGIL